MRDLVVLFWLVFLIFFWICEIIRLIYYYFIFNCNKVIKYIYFVILMYKYGKRINLDFEYWKMDLFFCF